MTNIEKLKQSIENLQETIDMSSSKIVNSATNDYFTIRNIGCISQDAITVERLHEHHDGAVYLVTHKAEAISPEHCHSSSVEHYVVLSGKLEICVSDNIKDTLLPGDTYSIDISKMHKVKTLEDSVYVVILHPIDTGLVYKKD